MRIRVMLVEAGQSGSEPVATGSIRARAIRGGSALIACKWLAQVVSWSVTLIVARLLAPADFGVVAAAGILLGLSDLFADAGVGRALVQKPGVTEADYDRAFTLSLLLSVACYVVLCMGTPAAARFLRTPELSAVLPVMGTVILLVPFKTVPQGILDRRLEMKSQGVVHLVSTALQASTVLTLAILGAGYWALVVGAMGARLFDCLLLAHLTGWRPRVVVDLRGARGLLSYGLWISGGSFLWYLYSNSDYAVVGRLEGAVVLGYYSLAFQLMSLPVQKVTANINQVAFPVFCRIQADRARAKQWYIRLTVLMIAAVLPTLLGAALVARDGIATLFGAKWLPAVVPFQILCIVGLLGVISASLISLLNALGRPDINFKYNAACACVFPPAFAASGSAYGVLGVCVAWAIVYVVAVSLLVFCTKSITSLGLGELLAAQSHTVLAAAVMTVSVLAVATVLRGVVPVPVKLSAEITMGVVTYAGVLWVTTQHTIVSDLRAVLRHLRSRAVE